MTTDELVDAGFALENWPEDLPKPGEDNIQMARVDGARLYRFEVSVSATPYAMEVNVLDGDAEQNPAEGVCFMLNQFAYLWRNNKPNIAVGADGSCRRINF